MHLVGSNDFKPVPSINMTLFLRTVACQTHMPDYKINGVRVTGLVLLKLFQEKVNGKPEKGIYVNAKCYGVTKKIRNRNTDQQKGGVANNKST